MSPQLYFLAMLITNPQKAKRILLAEELEDWFMDLFDEEYEDILEGTFINNQEAYKEKIVDKYLEVAKVKITDTDEYSVSVINKAYKSSEEIQDTTLKNIAILPQNELSDYIRRGIAIGTTLFATEEIRKWLSRERANLIALNEANWKYNNEEYYEAKSKHKTKIWHTALDEKVRLTHIGLEGVEKPINDYFDVGGYPALYPMDANLPISETANCRCTIEYK